MASHKVKRVPVVGNGRLVGIVARADLMRALMKTLPATQSTSADDEKIRQEVTAGLAKQSRSGLIRVDVHLGVVDLSAIIFDEHAREAAWYWLRTSQASGRLPINWPGLSRSRACILLLLSVNVASGVQRYC